MRCADSYRHCAHRFTTGIVPSIRRGTTLDSSVKQQMVEFDGTLAGIVDSETSLISSFTLRFAADRRGVEFFTVAASPCAKSSSTWDYISDDFAMGKNTNLCLDRLRGPFRPFWRSFGFRLDDLALGFTQLARSGIL